MISIYYVSFSVALSGMSSLGKHFALFEHVHENPALGASPESGDGREMAGGLRSRNAEYAKYLRHFHK